MAIVMEKLFVSIVIPVYNAEKTLAISIESLLNQSYSKIELVFVNDCSNDNSLELIKTKKIEFEERNIRLKRHVQIKIFSHDVNKGVAAARNTGLAHATGEYIYYLDADDAIEPDAIELLVKEALSKNSDIVGCNWYLTFAKNERKMNQPSFNSSFDAIQKILQGTMRWNLWLFLVKRSLYEDNIIRFMPGKNMGEDLMVMVKLFAYSSNVSFLDKPLYHYGQSNDQSLTKIYSPRHIEEVTANVQEVEDFLQNSPFKDKIGKLIPFMKLNIKLPLLISNKSSNYQLWRAWFPEVNAYVMDNKVLSLRIRLLQWAAAKRQYWLVKLHYFVIVRFVYGVIYK